jgi:hypothetical protein
MARLLFNRWRLQPINSIILRKGISVKKTALFLIVLALMLPVRVFAHVVNENTIYDDIQYSDAKADIVMLRGIGAIASPDHGVNLFKPGDKLTKAELAYWSAAFNKIGGEQATMGDLQRAAVANGLVDSLEGNATYGDVNKAYFAGKATVQNANNELTREQFALFMGHFLKEKVDGKTLYDRAGFEPGPTGVIEKVAAKTEGAGGNADKVFTLTVGGKQYALDPHPKVIRGPTDLTVWKGKNVESSWIALEGNRQVVKIIVAAKDQFSIDEISAGQQKPKKGLPIFPISVSVILVVLVGWLFKSRVRRGHAP